MLRPAFHWSEPLYDAARKLCVNAHSCVNAATQWAGVAALNGPQDAAHAMVAEFDRRRALVVEGLNRLPGVSCIAPKGAFYAFPNVSRTGWTAKALASALLEDSGVATIGGPDFGVHGEGYIRLSYANSAETSPARWSAWASSWRGGRPLNSLARRQTGGGRSRKLFLREASPRLPGERSQLGCFT